MPFGQTVWKCFYFVCPTTMSKSSACRCLSHFTAHSVSHSPYVCCWFLFCVRDKCVRLCLHIRMEIIIIVVVVVDVDGCGAGFAAVGGTVCRTHLTSSDFWLLCQILCVYSLIAFGSFFMIIIFIWCVLEFLSFCVRLWFYIFFAVLLLLSTLWWAIERERERIADVSARKRKKREQDTLESSDEMEVELHCHCHSIPLQAFMFLVSMWIRPQAILCLIFSDINNIKKIRSFCGCYLSFVLCGRW